MGAQGCRETCGLAGVLPPWHDGCHGSPVWCGFPLVGRYRPPLDRRSRGLRKGQCPLTPDCVLFAQGRKKTFGLAGVLPPWHDGCHGSPVWCGFPLVGRYRPPLDRRSRGLRKGQCPLTPDCVLFAQGRKKTFGLAGVLPPWHDGCHGSPVWCGFPLVGRYRPPSGDRPFGSQQGPVSFRKNVGSLRCRNIQLHVATFQPPLPL